MLMTYPLKQELDNFIININFYFEPAFDAFIVLVIAVNIFINS